MQLVIQVKLGLQLLIIVNLGKLPHEVKNG
jgi:hypothetical protein